MALPLDGHTITLVLSEISEIDREIVERNSEQVDLGGNGADIRNVNLQFLAVAIDVSGRVRRIHRSLETLRHGNVVKTNPIHISKADDNSSNLTMAACYEHQVCHSFRAARGTFPTTQTMMTPYGASVC